MPRGRLRGNLWYQADRGPCQCLPAARSLGPMRCLPLVLILAVLVEPLAAEAQPVARVYRIGMLEPTSNARDVANLNAFRQGPRELGYVEGQNFVIEHRSA